MLMLCYLTSTAPTFLYLSPSLFHHSHLHPKELLCAPAGAAKEAGGVALVDEDHGVVFVCQGLNKVAIFWFEGCSHLDILTPANQGFLKIFYCNS